MIALVCFVSFVTLIIVMKAGGRRPAAPEPVGDQVKIEVRAKPLAQVRMNGKPLGRTPLTVTVKRGTTPIEFEATFTVDKYRVKDRAKVTSVLKETRIVVPEANQSVDFDVDDAAGSTNSGK